MNKQKLMELFNNPESLPERAYTTLPSDPTEVIIVVNGETGYYRYQKYPTAELAKKRVITVTKYLKFQKKLVKHLPFCL